MKKNQGFTLIELMIVVAIIAIIAAIAIPNLLRSRMNANESAAMKSLKTISDAQGSYFTRNNVMAPSFVELTTPPAGPAYLNGVWDPGIPRSGYLFDMQVPDNYSFTATANPAVVDKSGSRAFFLDTGGNIHWALGAGPAGDGDPLISDN